MQYEVKASQHIRGVAIVTAPPDDPAHRLACAFSGGKYSPRECGYRMDAVRLKRFALAARLGCSSPDGETVTWSSRTGKAHFRFAPHHPERYLKAIAKQP